MSNSIKKPYGGHLSGSDSEKWSKQKWHRRFRRYEKLNIMLGREIEGFRSISNVDDMPKEGKIYYPNYMPCSDVNKLMRK
jgi:hypothetical protein